MAEEKKDERKKIDKAPTWMWWVLGIISVVIIVIFIIMIITKGKKEIQPVATTPAPTATASFEEFVLKVGEPVQTVEAGPGTHHRIQSDKKFIAVAIQQDGSERKYEMPAGTSYWNGAGPWGRLLLEGVEDGTRVKIAPIS